MNTLVALLTDRAFPIRAATGLLIGTAICFGSWAFSLAWLPEGFFLRLPLPTFGNCEANPANGVQIFLWNLLLSGGPVVSASLFAVGRLPCGYLVSWRSVGLRSWKSALEAENAPRCSHLPERTRRGVYSGGVADRATAMRGES